MIKTTFKTNKQKYHLQLHSLFLKIKWFFPYQGWGEKKEVEQMDSLFPYEEETLLHLTKVY